VAAMPTTLVEPCILAGSRPGDIVLDPFSGSGTVIDVANRLEREWLAIEIDPAFVPLHEDRTVQRPLPLLQSFAAESGLACS
jgi:DNA modification methylase